MTNKYLSAYAVVITIVAIFVACGGGSSDQHNGGGGTPPKQKSMIMGPSAIPGTGSLHSSAVTTATTRSLRWNWSLVTPVYAQTTTTTSVVGYTNGYCLGLPPQTSLQQSGFGAKDYSIVVYGGGQLTYPYCDGRTENNETFWGYWSETPLEAAAKPDDGLHPLLGFNVLGDGTLRGLKIRIRGGSGTNSTSGKFDVFVKRGTQTLSTGISCTVGIDVQCNDDTTGFQVFNLDRVLLVGTFHPADHYAGFDWYVGKE